MILPLLTFRKPQIGGSVLGTRKPAGTGRNGGWVQGPGVDCRDFWEAGVGQASFLKAWRSSSRPGWLCHIRQGAPVELARGKCFRWGQDPVFSSYRALQSASVCEVCTALSALGYCVQMIRNNSFWCNLKKIFYLLFWDSALLCSSVCPRTHCVGHIVLRLETMSLAVWSLWCQGSNPGLPASPLQWPI